MRIVLQPVGGYWCVAAIVAVLVALLWAAPPSAKLTPLRRRTLYALRWATILLTLVALLRPSLIHSTTIRQPATLVVLADASRSMTIDDAAGQLSRWQALRNALATATPALKRLAQEIDVRVFTYAAELEPVPRVDDGWPLPAEATGSQSALGAALDDVLRQTSGGRLAAVVVLSDGAQRALPPRDVAPQAAARRLADLTFPLYAVPLGQSRASDQARDVVLENFQAPAMVYVKNKLVVTGQLRADGYTNRPLPVQLLFETRPGEMTPVAAEQLQVSTAGTRAAIELDYTPVVSGEHKITLRAQPQPGELLTTNNEQSTFITVLSGGLNVLYLEGVPRAEAKFLRRSLDASPDIRLDFLRINARDQAGKPADFAERLKPGRYNVFLLGDLDAAALTADEHRALVEAIRAGAGCMMLGGFHSFGPGGWGRVALGEVLPIQIDRLERQNFDEPVRADLHLKTRPTMTPTTLGQGQSLLALGGARDANLAAWRKLPPLEGGNLFRALKPTAKLLAEGPAGEPLLVAQDYGAGRVLAFAGDSTWRWWMAGHEATHKRFWRQTILWLARRDTVDSDRVKLTFEQRRYAPGSRVEFSVRAEAQDGTPLNDVVFRAEVEKPAGAGGQTTTPALLRRQAEATVGTFTDTLAAGDYRLRVTGTQQGQEIGSVQARFLVYEQDLELDNSAADRSLLDSLAATTAGRSLAPEELPQLFEQLLADVARLEVETEIKRSLWDTWPFFIMFALVLVAEWYARKKWGLV